VILRYVATRALTLPVNLAANQAVAGIAATAQTDFDVKRSGASVGTMTFAASGTVASFSAGAEITHAPATCWPRSSHLLPMHAG
jgi:hypothetical protein